MTRTLAFGLALVGFAMVGCLVFGGGAGWYFFIREPGGGKENAILGSAEKPLTLDDIGKLTLKEFKEKYEGKIVHIEDTIDSERCTHCEFFVGPSNLLCEISVESKESQRKMLGVTKSHMAMVKGKWVEPRKMTDCVIIRIGRVITNGKGPEPIPVATAEQLSKEFDDDPVAAEARYENGVIVSAVVAGIAKPLDDNYSTLNTSGKTLIRAELWGFSETMKLARGDKIEIRSNSMRRKDNEVIVNIRMLHRLD